jgi:PKD repeat protein
MSPVPGSLGSATCIAVLSAIVLQAEAPDQPDPSPLDSLQVTQVRANTYTFSAQEDPSIAIDAEGRLLVTWSSRRQERGNYGVFAQLFDPLGRPLTTEMHVNQTLPGSQKDSYVTFAPDGAAWVVWNSMDKRTANNGVFLRKLADTKEGFQPVGDEIFVAGTPFELHTDPAIDVNEDGELLVAWVKNEPHRRTVEARRFNAAGEPLGEILRPGTAVEESETVPDLVALPGGDFLAVWGRASDTCIPLGIWGRRIGAEGVIGEEFLVSDLPDLWHVEPSLDIDGEGRLVVAWMTTREGAASYEVRARRLDPEGQPIAPSFTVEAGGEGYRNGAAVAMANDGSFVVAYNVHGGTYQKSNGRSDRQVDIRARVYDADGTPRGEGRLVHSAGEGRHAMQVAQNGRHIAWSDDGALAFAWTGTHSDDGSAVVVNLFTPGDLDVPAPAAIEPVAACADLTAHDMEREAPPDPLPNWIRSLPRGPNAYGISTGFIAHNATAWSPPDPDIAVGPDRIISQVNMEIACFDKNGVEQWRQDNTGSSGFFGSVGAQDFVFDPISVWDTHDNRFIVVSNELDDPDGYVCLAVSKDSTPDNVNDWWKYRFKTSPSCDFPDFPNLGINKDYIYITTDCFDVYENRVIIFEKSSVLNGSLGTVRNKMMYGNLQSLGNTNNYDSANSAQYFITSFTTSGYLKIQCLQTPTQVTPDQAFVAVSTWSGPPDAPQQGTSHLLSTIDERIKNGIVRNGRLYACHGVGTGGVTKVRWYEIDLRGWPFTSSPVLLQQGTLNLGTGVYSWFPDIGVDDLGNITVSYNRSAASEMPSIEAAYQIVGDATGTMRTPIRLKTSGSSYPGDRYGDYSGLDEDPANPGTFWSHAEYSVGAWETWVAPWTVSAPDVPVANFSAAPTSGNEDLLVTFTDLSTGAGLSSWTWDFGDTGASALQHPTHTYVDPGTYTVSLTVVGSAGNDTEIKTDLIEVFDVFDASWATRNGSGVNPDIFTSTNLPILGADWTSEVDAGSVGVGGFVFVFVYAGGLPGTPTAFGELLLDPSAAWLFTDLAIAVGGISQHAIGVPADPAFAGNEAFAQGYLNGVAPSGQLTNAIDLVLGY